MKQTNALPSWADDGAANVRSAKFQELSFSLDVTLGALAGATVAAAERPGTYPEVLQLFARGQDLVKTLRTICRAHLGLSAADTAAVKARGDIGHKAAELNKLVEPIFRDLAERASNDPIFSAHPELRLWKEARRLRGTILDDLPPDKVAFANDVSASVLEPVRALHTHLTSTMALNVKDSDGHSRIQGFGASIAVLKNADDPVLRRTTFEAMNAWFASHSPSFLDVLNAHTGFHLALLKLAGEELFPYVMRSERMDLRVYRALFNALEARLPRIRLAVSLRQRAFGDGPMRVWNLLSPSPDALYTKGRFFWGAIEDLKRAFAQLNPEFTKFLDTAAHSGWIDAHGQSMKTGGTWCDDLPALDAVRILANYLPTLSGEAALSHLLGAAWHMQVLHQAPAPARVPMLAMTELAGNFSETILSRSLLRAAENTPEEKLHRWQMLKRLTNCLLTIPARHRLLKHILLERQKGLLSLETVNKLSVESWHHYFGDAAVGEDRYVWAYKTHFYRTQPVFYDWQYTFGFLLSQVLADQFEQHGSSASGANLKSVWIDSATLPANDFAAKHLHADLASQAFWLRAVDRALLPVTRLENKPDYFSS